MAYQDELLSDEERQRLLGGQGSSAPATPGGGPNVGAGASAPSPEPSSGFQNLSAYFNANKDQAQAQGEQIASKLEGSANEAALGNDPGKAEEVLGQVNAASTPGGLATVLPEQHKEDANYTSGMAGLDAYLGTRGTSPERFSKIKEMFGPKLQGVEAPPEAPGEMPTAPQLPDLGGNWRGNASERGRLLDEYGQKMEEYQRKRAAYEAWAKRRAERLGQTYAPATQAPPAQGPLNDIMNRLFGQYGG